MTHDTDWTDYPTCPECGHVDEEWWEPGRLENDGDTTPVECPACGADYLAEAHMQRHFSTEPLADALRRRIAQHERQLAGPVFGIPSLGAGVPGLRDAVRDSLVSGLEKARADLAKVEERERVRKGIK